MSGNETLNESDSQPTPILDSQSTPILDSLKTPIPDSLKTPILDSQSTATPDSQGEINNQDNHLQDLLSLLISTQDHHKLSLFGIKHGFLTNSFRQQVYPILLKFSLLPIIESNHTKLNELMIHQLKCDVDRSFSNMNFEPRELVLKRMELLQVLEYVFSNYPYFHYYQGLHSICSILLLILGIEDCKKAILVLGHFWLRDYMLPSIEQTVKHLEAIELVISNQNPKLFQHLKAEVADYDAIFLISWILTWLSMQTEQSTTYRLFDCLISTKPDFIIHLSASIILNFQQEFMDCEEMTQVYTIVKNFDWNQLNFNNIIEKAIKSSRDNGKGLQRKVGKRSVLTTFYMFENSKTRFDLTKIEQLMQCRNGDQDWIKRGAVVVVVVAIGLGMYMQYSGLLGKH